MKAEDFYRILSQVQGMLWTVESLSPSTTFIRGTRYSFPYSPLSAVAAAVEGRFVDVCDRDVNRILRLDRRVYQRILDATYMHPGYSRAVRSKLLESCGLRD